MGYLYSYNVDENDGIECPYAAAQVTNMASMPLTVGLKNALAVDQSVLGVLLPGSFLWLPVLRAEPGMLYIQPAGEAIRLLNVEGLRTQIAHDVYSHW